MSICTNSWDVKPRKSQTTRSNSLDEKPPCDVHEEIKWLQFIQHFSCVVHNNSVRQAGVGINTHVPYREWDAVWFMHLSPWKTELQAKSLWLVVLFFFFFWFFTFICIYINEYLHLSVYQAITCNRFSNSIIY